METAARAITIVAALLTATPAPAFAKSPWGEDEDWTAALGHAPQPPTSALELARQPPDGVARIRDIRARLRSSDSTKVIQHAIRDAVALGEGGTALLGEIAGLLGSVNGWAAAHALCDFHRAYGLSGEVRALVLRTAGGGDAPTTCHALEVLACVGESDSALFPAISRFVFSEDPYVRSAALRAVAGAAPSRGADLVLQAAHTDSSRLVRGDALRLIPSVIPDFPAAWTHLRRCVEDEDIILRCTAAETIGEYGGDAAPAVRELIAWMGNGEPELALSCARTLGRMGEAARPALPALVALLDAEIEREEAAWRRSPVQECPHPTPPWLVATIAALDPEAAAPAVVRMLASDVGVIREMGARAATRLP